MRQVLFIQGAGRLDGPGGGRPLVDFLSGALAPHFRLSAPQMPDPDNPDARAWLDSVEVLLDEFSEDGVLIGHSLGGSILLKCIAERRPGFRAAGLVMLASPFWGAPDWEVDEYRLPDGFDEHLGGVRRVTLLHGGEDEVVPVAHLEVYAARLPHAEALVLDGVRHDFATGGETVAAAVRRM